MNLPTSVTSDRPLVRSPLARQSLLMFGAGLLVTAALGALFVVPADRSYQYKIETLTTQLSHTRAQETAVAKRLAHTNALLKKLLAEERKANAARALQQEENNAATSWLTGG